MVTGLPMTISHWRCLKYHWWLFLFPLLSLLFHFSELVVGVPAWAWAPNISRQGGELQKPIFMGTKEHLWNIPCDATQSQERWAPVGRHWLSQKGILCTAQFQLCEFALQSQLHRTHLFEKKKKRTHLFVLMKSRMKILLSYPTTICLRVWSNAVLLWGLFEGVGGKPQEWTGEGHLSPQHHVTSWGFDSVGTLVWSSVGVQRSSSQDGERQ